jgi:hypothetical protein
MSRRCEHVPNWEQIRSNHLKASQGWTARALEIFLEEFNRCTIITDCNDEPDNLSQRKKSDCRPKSAPSPRGFNRNDEMGTGGFPMKEGGKSLFRLGDACCADKC